jgi:type IV pilus assembly protein PilX
MKLEKRSRHLPSRNCALLYPCASRQGGASLIVSLVMLVAVLLLGISAARVALQSEKASRNDRDRQIALQSAEAGLMDAELDIEGASGKEMVRSRIFGKDKTEGFTEGCGGGLTNIYLGLCTRAEEGEIPAWQKVDFLDSSAGAKSVPYGRFTGQSFQTGKGSLPAKLPRYVIELMPYNKEGEGANNDNITYFYRISAIGFGVRETTQVVLQTFYRKDGQ